MIKAVADTTNERWSTVYEMNIYEFFNVLSFAKRYNQEMVDRAKQTMK